MTPFFLAAAALIYSLAWLSERLNGVAATALCFLTRAVIVALSWTAGTSGGYVAINGGLLALPYMAAIGLYGFVAWRAWAKTGTRAATTRAMEKALAELDSNDGG